MNTLIFEDYDKYYVVAPLDTMFLTELGIKVIGTELSYEGIDYVIKQIDKKYNIKIEPNTKGVGEYSFIYGARVIFSGHHYSQVKDIIIENDYHFNQQQQYYRAIKEVVKFLFNRVQ
jgi:hypothetical protein